MGFPLADAARIEGSGAMFDELSRASGTTNEVALVGMKRDLAPANLKVVRTGVGAALRTLHDDVLREEVPDRIAELLMQLDQQKGADNA
jgi:Anti-sigma factor NepR